MSFSLLQALDSFHLYHYQIPTSPTSTYIAEFKTKGYTLISTVIWNSMNSTMAESPNSPDGDEPLIQLSQSCQLLAQSAGCLPRDHCLKPKFEELMGDLETEITKMKKDPERYRQKPTGSTSIDTPPIGPKEFSSPSPNIARPKPERRPTPEFFRQVARGPILTGFTPQKDFEIQNPGGRKLSHSHGRHGHPSRIEKRRKPVLTPGQKGLRKIRKIRAEMSLKRCI